MKTARQYLAVFWLLAGGGILIYVSIQSTEGYYASKTRDVWEWLIPMVVPTMTLVIGVLVAEVRAPGHGNYSVGKLLYYTAFLLSAAYLCFLLWVVLNASWYPPSLPVMKRSSFGLGVLQSLTALALGAFFVQGDYGQPSDD